MRQRRREQGHARAASSSTARATTSRPPPRCGCCSANLPEACDNTLAIAEHAKSPSTRAPAPTCRSSRCPTARRRSRGSIKEVRRGLEVRFPDGVPDYAIEQAEFEEQVITARDTAGYFLVVADYIKWAKENGIRVGPASARRRFDVRVRDEDHRPRPGAPRPDLRAVPQPRTPLDARLRRRLRRAPPGRGHPATSPRSTATTGCARSSPTARSRRSRRSRTPAASSASRTHSATRSRRSTRPPSPGQRRRDRRRVQPRARPLRRGDGVPRALQLRPRREARRRHRPRHRGPQAAVGRPRGRRHHVEQSR